MKSLILLALVIVAAAGQVQVSELDFPSRYQGQSEFFDQGVSKPFTQYVNQQGRYYSQREYSDFAAESSYQHLQQAEQYAQNALEYFANSNVQQQYIYHQLQQGLVYAQKGQSLYQSYEHSFVPNYAAQHYEQLAEQAYQHFFSAYQYIQEQGQVNFPQYLVQQIQYAYLAAQRAYQTYQRSDYYQGSYTQAYPSGIRDLIERYFNTDAQYHYGPSAQGFEYQYGPSAAYQYGSNYGPYRSSGYQYGSSYGPYRSSAYQYGSYPYQYGSYGPVYQGESNSYGYPYAFWGRSAQIAAAGKLIP